MGSASVSHPPTRHPFRCRLLGLAPHYLDSWSSRFRRGYPLESQTPEKPFLFASHLDQRGVGQTQWHRTLLRSRVSLLPSATASPLRLVHHCSASCSDLHGHHHRCFSCTTGRSP